MSHWLPVRAEITITDDGDEIACVPFGATEWRWFARSSSGAIVGSGSASNATDARQMASAAVAVPFGGDA